VFVPGFKGSVLVDADSGEEIWVTAYQALFGSESLQLALPGEEGSEDSGDDEVGDDSENKEKFLNLRPYGLLRSVTVIPWLANYSVYQPVVERIQEASAGDATLFNFDYDWRQDLTSSAAQLDKFIRSLKLSGYHKVTLVAHSMGGIVSAYYLRYGAQPLETAQENWAGAADVDSVIFAATPFLGALTILRDMQKGVQSGLNTTLLSPEAMSSFPASYQLLPPEFVKTIISTDGKTPPSIYNPEVWQAYRWALLRKMGTPRLEFINSMLTRATKLYSLIHAPLVSTPPSLRIVCIIGQGTGTLATALSDPEKKTFIFDDDPFPEGLKDINEEQLHADGDGLVTVTSAQLPESWRQIGNVKTIYVNARHLETLYTDKFSYAVQSVVRN